MNTKTVVKPICFGDRSATSEACFSCKVVNDCVGAEIHHRKTDWPLPQEKHSHYFKDVSKLSTIDVYRVLELFGVTDPCVQHAVKKLLVAGGRGVKNMDKDIQEAIDTLQRWQAMRVEDRVEIA